jgi:hypothetical protein
LGVEKKVAVGREKKKTCPCRCPWNEFRELREFGELGELREADPGSLMLVKS